MRLLLVVLILGLALYSNPNLSLHQEAVRNEIKKQTNSKSKDNLASKLGQKLNQAVSQMAVEALMQYDNYYLASATRIQLNSQSQILSVGVFGQVRVMSNELTF